MKATEVVPKDWRHSDYPIIVLFDNGEYSVIWGKYKDTKALGVRWNDGQSRGYPGQGAHPTWYVEPDFIAIAILHHLLTMALAGNQGKYLDNIRFAISELKRQILFDFE